MIKFFRKIRYNLMETGKTGKYLKYAIGEIVLVVIGILIALQVNNWNENRSKFKEQSKTIENLNLELKSNLINLNTTIKLSELARNLTYTLLLSMNDSTTNKFKGEKLDSLLSKIHFPIWSRSNINLSSIQSSGNLNNVGNSELKNLIYGWISQIENVEYFEKKSDYAWQYYIDYIKKNGSWREIDKFGLGGEKGSQLIPSNDHLLLSPEFENCLNELFIWETHKKGKYQETRERLIKLIEFTES